MQRLKTIELGLDVPDSTPPERRSAAVLAALEQEGFRAVGGGKAFQLIERLAPVSWACARPALLLQAVCCSVLRPRLAAQHPCWHKNLLLQEEDCLVQVYIDAYHIAIGADPGVFFLDQGKEGWLF